MNDNVEIIRSNKGGMKIIHRGYMYTVHKKRQGGGIRWRCTQRSLHCKGSISTGNGPPSVNMPHNHIPDPHSVALARCRQLEDIPDISSLLETEYDDLKDLFHQRLEVPRSDSRRQSASPQRTKPKEAKSDGASEEVCLRWNSHHSNMQTAFPQLLEKERYVDCTIVAEGRTIKCHKMVICSCSPYFEEILSDIIPTQHPVVILKDIPFWSVRALIDFMYVGEVNIDQGKLPELLDVAELLKVKGLAGKSSEKNNADTKTEEAAASPPSTLSAPAPSPPIVPAEAAPKSPVHSPPTVKSEEKEKPVDPLNLLEPKSEGISASPPKPKEAKIPPKKHFTRKIRKRKSSDDEMYHPLFPMRRGTRSRPNIKLPKCFYDDDIVKPVAPEVRPFSPTDIKTEPLEIEENDIFYEDSVGSDGSRPEAKERPKATKSKEAIPGLCRIQVKKCFNLEEGKGEKDESEDEEKSESKEEEKGKDPPPICSSRDFLINNLIEKAIGAGGGKSVSLGEVEIIETS